MTQTPSQPVADAQGLDKSEAVRIASRSKFDAHIGTEWLALGGDEARARIAVREHHEQPFGLVHGGVFATLAESLCSAATYSAVGGEGIAVVGQSNQATFLHPISEGHVNAVGRPIHRGRTSWIWDVDITDDDGRLCSVVRMIIGVRPTKRDGGES